MEGLDSGKAAEVGGLAVGRLQRWGAWAVGGLQRWGGMCGNSTRNSVCLYS